MSVEVFDLPLSGLRLPDQPNIPARRLIGNKSFHDAAFLAKYDHRTLFYDCFSDQESGRIALLGPPLLNFKELVTKADFRLDDRPVGIHEIQDLSRCSITLLDAEAGHEVQVKHPLFEGRMAVNPNFVESFSGLNGLYTISLNNRLEWIADWLDYYVRLHGAETVVLADNGSTAYPAAALRRTLASIRGLRRAVILRAPFPFGPTAENKAGYAALFLQRSLAELGRRRFFKEARAVMNADIDELVHSWRGRSIFDATVAAATGYVRANAQWVYAPNPGSAGFARHRDHSHVSLSGKPKSNRKYCVAPTGPQGGKQWLTHFINDRKDPVDPDFYLWHFRQISTGWKYERGTFDTELIPDRELSSAMQSAFPDTR